MLLEIIEQYFSQVLVLVLVMTIFFIVKGKIKKRSIRGRFKSNGFLNTKAEQNFFTQLSRKLPEDCKLMCKVRLADLCLPENHKNVTGFNKIARKHVDFVVIDSFSSKVLYAIELDDKSHLKMDAIRRDKEKDYALKSSGIALYRIKATRNYSGAIDKMLRQISGEDKKEAVEGVINNSGNGKRCPRCNEEMVVVRMKLFNRGKGYYLCNFCRFNTEPAPIRS